LKYSTPDREEEISNRDPDTLVGWPENYPYIADCKKVLDIGCGVGNVVRWLQQRGHEAKGVTYQIAEVGTAITNGIRGVHCADMHELPYSDKAFDAVIFWDALEHSLAPLAALLEAKRVVKPGGKGLIFIPSQEWIEYGPHIIVPTIRQMKHLLVLAGLEIVEIVDTWGNDQAVYKVRKGES
jgi:ubiquinone/menaquinone biosynthesis C-methylase UbiE